MTGLVNISEAASLGLHTMALLAQNGRKRHTTQEIAKALRASAHHLAKVMQRLTKAGLVTSVRGPQGGFLMERPAGEITLLEIYEAIEGRLAPHGCFFRAPLCVGTDCVLGEVILSARQQLERHFSKTTLDELSGRCGLMVTLGSRTNEDHGSITVEGE